jgi:hypothetical protein
MAIKSLAALLVSIGAVAGISVSPAQADNNKALNQLAMQMYAQNMAQGQNYALTNPYGVYGNYGAGYGYTGQTPWSAGAQPYAYASGNPYANRYGTYRKTYHGHPWWH